MPGLETRLTRDGEPRDAAARVPDDSQRLFKGRQTKRIPAMTNPVKLAADEADPARSGTSQILPYRIVRDARICQTPLELPTTRPLPKPPESRENWDRATCGIRLAPQLPVGRRSRVRPDQPIATTRRIGTPVFGRAKSLVGLDIGSSAVKAVELKQAGKSYKVTAFGAESVPP